MTLSITNYLLNVGWLVVLFSCTRSPSDTIIRPMETSSGDFTAQVTQSVLLAPGNEILIDEITLIEFYRDRFYVFDRPQRNVIIFNKDGAFSTKIPKGKGPGELRNPEGMSCSGDHLIVMDWPEIKIYSLDGTYLDSKKTGKTAEFSEVLKGSEIPEVLPMNTANDEFLCLFQPTEFTDEQLTQFKKEGLIDLSIGMENNPVVFFVSIQDK